MGALSTGGRLGASLRTTVVTLFVASAMLLSGCAATRDADGHVLRTMVLSSADMAVDDCFSFVDPTNVAQAEVTPCDQVHTHIVIGRGSLSEQAITQAGSLQNAVSQACSDEFKAFKSDAPAGVKPELQFVVTSGQKDGAAVKNYSCVATDSISVAAGG
jgi:hypothetical protein